VGDDTWTPPGPRPDPPSGHRLARGISYLWFAPVVRFRAIVCDSAVLRSPGELPSALSPNTMGSAEKTKT
jgi:hypothetical protein